MRYFIAIVVCLAVVIHWQPDEALAEDQWTPSDDESDVSRHYKLLETILTVSEQLERDAALRSAWEKGKASRQGVLQLPGVDFSCDTSIGRSPQKPTSVHEVRPGDIDVIAAFGDSITAGNGLAATNLPAVAIENRGESWCIGGQGSLDEGIITLPNIIRKFNPNLKGYSICRSTRDNRHKSWFNAAEPGGDNTDMPPQADNLIEWMKADSRVNFTDDWKLLTMFVGGNDLCAVCETSKTNVSNYYARFEQALTTLSDNVPRMIVNLVSMFDVTPVQNFSTGIPCDLLQWHFCFCARNQTTLPTMKGIQLEYHEQLQRLADDPRFKKSDFHVVLQPHLRDMVPPLDANGDYLQGFLSPDCFHPNRIAHQAFASWLWNTMLTPLGKKPFKYDTDGLLINTMKLTCPTVDHPFIFTDQNSGLTTVEQTTTVATTTTTTPTTTTTISTTSTSISTTQITTPTPTPTSTTSSPTTTTVTTTTTATPTTA
jgi:phospholipase B1